MSKIPSLSNIFSRFAKSNIGQKVYKNLLKPEKEVFLNNTLPLIESGVCTGSYCFATWHDKHIPEEQKPCLQWQNIINGVVGIAISGKMNKWITKQGSGVIKHLNSALIKNFSSVVNGIQVSLPIIMTSLVMRYGVSTLSVPMSEKFKELGHKKLDVEV